MRYQERKKFLFEQYSNSNGKAVDDLTETEKTVLEWAADLMDNECLIILDIIPAPLEWDETALRVKYICFPIHYMHDDDFEGDIVYEEGLLGETFFEYETREFGYAREDIEWFIEEYRAFEEKIDILEKSAKYDKMKE